MIRSIAFDLDDTLLDTSGLLLGAAAQEACTAMIREGLPGSLEQCLRLRADLAANLSHKEVFPEIARRLGSSASERIGSVGVQIFYNAPIPSALPLMKGAYEVLRIVKDRYRLFLVTAGAPATQWEKIRATGLEPFFEKIFVIDKMKNEQKRSAFQEILQTQHDHPQELLSVGNRLAEEIRQAKQLGALTCHFEYGEHAGEEKFEPEDHPDYTIHSWAEFLPSCHL